MNIKNHLEEQEDQNFEEADITAFNGDTEKHLKFHQLKDEALSFLRSMENTLFRIRTQIVHEQALQNGMKNETDIPIHPATGKKKILDLNESNMHVDKKSHLQDNIDKNRVAVMKGLVSIELMQMYEKELENKIIEQEEVNKQKIVAIKTQLYQLRTLQFHISKLINLEKTENLSAHGKSNRMLSSTDKGSEASRMTGRVLKDRKDGKDGNQMAYSQD